MEEIGIHEDKITIIGALDDIHTAVTNYRITPYVGFVEEQPEYTLSEHEAERIIEIPIKSFLNKAFFKEEEWMVEDGNIHKVYYFDHGDDVVWGATARILHQFLTLCYGF